MQVPEEWRERLAVPDAPDVARWQQMRCIAHDLASPLTPMRLQLSIWRHAGVDLAGLSRLERSIDRMQRLVEDVVNLAAFEGEGLGIDAATTDLREVIDDVVASHTLQASSQHIKLSRRTEGSLVSWADADRIAQVLDNLLRNALKFTPRGGTVAVDARRLADSIQIAVADTGRGMAHHERARLFRPYSQLRRTDAQKGTGLGLFICKNIILAHQGALWVESDGPGKGSRFVMEIPAVALANDGSGSCIDGDIPAP